jgi:mRNA interferase MazF
MDKDFSLWNKQKTKLEGTNPKKYFHQGEMWWCRLGLNLKNESCGKGAIYTRPVLIIKKLSATSAIIVPLTSTKKIGSWYYNLSLPNCSNSIVQLHQIRLISIIRLCNRIFPGP